MISTAISIPEKISQVLKRQLSTRKVIKLGADRPIIQKLRARNLMLEEQAKAMGLEWRIVASSILHRYPVITPDTEEWEKAMWEVQHKIDLKKREWFMSQTAGTDNQLLSEDIPEPEDIAASMPFKPASRITEADLSNDHRSLNRKLPRSLFLMVKRNRNNHSWQFPQGQLRGEENLRQSAERIIDRAVGKIRRYFISNAPVGHLCYAYPEELQKQRNQFGAKVFFYRTQLIEGSIKLETRLYTDYAWLAREEVSQYVDADTSEFLEAIVCE